MDKYDVAQDHYCYDGTSILKNKLNIQSNEQLEEAEQEITALTVQDISYSPPPYDLAYLQQLHKIIFSALYDWAGEIRTVDISKGNTRFCNVNYEPMKAIFLRIVEPVY